MSRRFGASLEKFRFGYNPQKPPINTVISAPLDSGRGRRIGLPGELQMIGVRGRRIARFPEIADKP